jgi:hypothetical protein
MRRLQVFGLIVSEKALNSQGNVWVTNRSMPSSPIVQLCGTMPRPLLSHHSRRPLFSKLTKLLSG